MQSSWLFVSLEGFYLSSPGSFSISGLILKSLTHFELIFVQGERYQPDFILLQGNLISPVFVKRLSLL